MTTSRLSLAALFGVAAAISFVAGKWVSGSTAQLEVQIQELTASMASLQEQNSRLTDQNTKLESIRSELKRLVCDSTGGQVQAPVAPSPVPAPPVQAAVPQAPAQPVKEQHVDTPVSSNPAANMNAPAVEEPIHFPFDLSADRQRQVEDMMLRHNTENLTEFQQRFAGRQPEAVELAQFAKERKEKLLQNLRGVLDDEQFRQAESMLLLDKH